MNLLISVIIIFVIFAFARELPEGPLWSVLIYVLSMGSGIVTYGYLER